jgi:hypothetical protein
MTCTASGPKPTIIRPAIKRETGRTLGEAVVEHQVPQNGMP